MLPAQNSVRAYSLAPLAMHHAGGWEMIAFDWSLVCGWAVVLTINYWYGAALSWMNMHTSSVKPGN